MDIKSFFKINNNDIFNNYPDGILILNNQKEIISCNKIISDIFGYSKKEITGKNICEFLNQDIDLMYKYLYEEKRAIVETSTKWEEKIYIEISSSILKNSEILITIREITSRQKNFEKLLTEYNKISELNVQKSALIANLSSEIKTPLHSVIGFSQALLDGICGELNEKQEKYISIISKNSSSLLSVLSNIIDISTFDADKIQVNPKTFDIIQLINSCTDTIRPFCDAKNLKISTDLLRISKRSAFSDENLVRKILTILLSNAVKFTQSGSITIKAVYPDLEFVKNQGIQVPSDFVKSSYIMISIADTGKGLSEIELNTIFNEFEQSLSSKASKNEGTGLSLALVKRIIKKLGGKIFVESKVDHGSIFNFIIPVEKIQ